MHRRQGNASVKLGSADAESVRPAPASSVRQVNKDQSEVHHDALEFPNGQIVLLTQLCEGQRATVCYRRGNSVGQTAYMFPC